jgi:hypothetical protein
MPKANEAGQEVAAARSGWKSSQAEAAEGVVASKPLEVGFEAASLSGSGARGRVMSSSLDEDTRQNTVWIGVANPDNTADLVTMTIDDEMQRSNELDDVHYVRARVIFDIRKQQHGGGNARDWVEKCVSNH